MKIRIILLLSLMFVSTIYSTGFCMIETLSLKSLIKNSKFIIIATSVEVKPALDEVGSTSNVIENYLKVETLLKGSIETPNFKIDTIAGLEDEPVFVESGKYLLFLINAKGKLRTTNAIQGCWPITPDGRLVGMGHGKTLEDVKKAIEAENSFE
jgi:hypothetical protein